MTLTRRGIGLVVAGGASWLSAQVFGTPELQIAAVAILVLVGLAALSLACTSVDLHVHRLANPSQLAFGGTGTVTLTITNRSRRPTVPVRFHDQAPSTLADPARATLPPLGGGQRVELAYRLRGDQRGAATLGPLRTEFQDPFGLVVRRMELPGTSAVTVRPKVTPLPSGLPLAGVGGGSGEGRPRPHPGGENLAEVREYSPGDPLKAIHWASTAHRGKLMVRNEETPLDPRATILLDLRSSRHRGDGPTASLESAVHVAASAATHLARRGQAVALVDRPSTDPTPSRSADGWLDHLADVGPMTYDLRQVVAPLTKGGVVGGTLIAIVTPPDSTDLHSLVRAGRGASLRVAVLIDIASHDPRSRRHLQVDLTSAAAALRAAGWRVTTLAATDELAAQWPDLLHVRRPRAVPV